MEINKQDIEKERKIIKELQQQLAEKDKEIERLNDRLDKYISGRLKSMLAEKDKKIKSLEQQIENNHMDYVSELAYYTAEENIKEIRKQVCDAIREKLKKQIITTAGIWLSYYDITEINDSLDKIENGEEV